MMMSNAFNSTTEIALRFLLSLYANDEALSGDELVILDFITVYGKDFGITSYNLHGDNKTKESELPARRRQSKDAIRFLTTQGYIDVVEDEKGFLFCISEKGTELCDAMESTYAADYTAASIKAFEYAKHNNLELLLSDINRKAVNFRKEGEV